ncbi:Glycosyl phosphatidyl inositol protein transamidase complex subunit [Teratosphaeriaceae sp. CCFEE 6253]|nr:Glycosyl phosphatidyl inositol protein transamidase complex subunit [Teratosphaeriaceae sp. CCFEE 6253]
MALSARLLALRHTPLLLQLPPYLSALCIVIGIAWLFLLPLDEYSRRTYVSENAILPGQVHTYFGGSEHNVFRAYRQEVYQIAQWSESDRYAALGNVMREMGLKVATQPYQFRVAGEQINGTNVYGLLQGPRADATEAMVLIAAWRNFDDEINYSGVALALTLARYFTRWSIWSKDILLLLPADSTYGPQAWVTAYHHPTHPPITPARNISRLPLKAGALQAAIALDYPAGPWGHRFDRLDIQYDGLNGALPNLDLLNTAVAIASGQLGIGCSIHAQPASHRDRYADRLATLLKGLATQSAGHATGPHSAFVPYHVDAITLKAVGDGWHDEMSLGRTAESLFRSVNNLLEHLHQSFFFYLLLGAGRFASIGTYLPAAMLLAGSFTISALALWVRSGQVPDEGAGKPGGTGEKGVKVEMEVVKLGGDVALVPRAATGTADREMLLPALVLLGVHLAGLVPLYLFNTVHRDVSPPHPSSIPPPFKLPRLTLPQNHYPLLYATTALSLGLPPAVTTIIAALLPLRHRHAHAAPTHAQLQILQALSLLLLGAALATLATLNFSLAFLLGIAAAPLNFLYPLPSPSSSPLDTLPHAVTRALGPRVARVVRWVLEGVVGVGWVGLWCAVSPPIVLFWVCGVLHRDPGWVMLEMARGWQAQGVYTAFVVWVVWWPAWVVGGVVMGSGAAVKGGT